MNQENEEQTSSSATASAVGNTGGKSKHPSNFIGRHRLQAAISHLEQQIKSVQEEIDVLDSVDTPSTVCKEIISGMESVPDPLLPITKGPVDVNWERWFGASSSRIHRRWI